MKVYAVTCDWQYFDNYFYNMEIFDTFEKALRSFNELIEDGKNNHPWLSELFEPDATEEYRLNINLATDSSEETDLWWKLNDKTDINNYYYIRLQIMEVHKENSL